MSFVSSILRVLRPYRRKVPTVLQMEATECGAASLAMVLAYFGRYEPLEKLRVDCGVSRNGSKASLILKAARQYHLVAKGFQAPLEALDELGTPLIIFWDFEHFVVYEGRSRDGRYYYINDPAVGPRTLDREFFESSYTGVALSFSKEKAFEKKGKPLSVFAAMLPMLSGMKSVMSAVIWGGLLLVIPGIMIPTLMRVFVDDVLPGKQSLLVPVLALFALSIALQILLSYLVKLALRRGELQLAVNKTMEMLNYLFTLPMEFFLQRTTGDIQNRVGLNSSVANAAFGSLADNVVKFLTAGFFLVLMFQFSPILSMVALSFVVVEMFFLFLITKLRQVLNQSMLMANTKLLSSLMSGVEMMENLRAGGREDDVFQQWTGQLAELNQKQLRFQNFSAMFNVLPTFLTGLGNILILSIGAYEIIADDLTLGGMFAFQTLMASFTGPFSALLMASSELQGMKGDLERINDVYKYAPDATFKPEDGEPARALHVTEFEMRDITFGYSKQAEPLLKDFSLKVGAGKRVALVGASGSGKTTLAKLANGTLRPWSGDILLNGQPLSDYKRSEFYASVGTVDQSIMLFSGSIGENLTLFAPQWDLKEIQRAVRDASIESELASRGSLMDLKLSEGGTNFSGGQRQRLEIARALTYRTPLLILDEATSALDPVTEMKIDQAIRRRGCACIIVAHRLSTIRDCDEIIMLEQGEIVERGKHEELIALNGAYAELMQLEEGEQAS